MKFLAGMDNFSLDILQVGLKSVFYFLLLFNIALMLCADQTSKAPTSLCYASFERKCDIQFAVALNGSIFLLTIMLVFLETV